MAGALAGSLADWLVGGLILPEFFGLRLTPAPSPEWLHPRLIWGGLWGLLFLASTPPRWTLPFRGLMFSLAPSAVTLLYLFPFRQEAGWLGLGLSLAAAPLVLAGNAVWGLVAGMALDLCGYLELMRDRLKVKAVKI